MSKGVFMSLFIDNLLHPTILFFILGLVVSLLKSDLDVPDQISKFLSIYLLMSIGLNSGYELGVIGISISVAKFFVVCILFAVLIPTIGYFTLRYKHNVADSSLIAACYGSVSAVTFLAATSFLIDNEIKFDGYITTALGLMEFPAIIVGLIFYKLFTHAYINKKQLVKYIIQHTLLDSSIVLLLGSIAIGYISGMDGKEEMMPFISNIFKGMLALYLLDIGIKAGRHLPQIVNSSFFLIIFAIVVPIINGIIGILVSHFILHFDIGNSLLVTMLFASASYLVVPSSMSISIPDANSNTAVTITLVITFTFNVLLAMPVYYFILEKLQ